MIISKICGAKKRCFDNSTEICDENLRPELKLGASLIKPFSHLKSNGIIERMIQTVKMGLKVFFSTTATKYGNESRLFLCYKTVSHASRLENYYGTTNEISYPIRQMKKIWNKKERESSLEKGNS